MKKIFLIINLCVLSVPVLLAHGPKKHLKSKPDSIAFDSLTKKVIQDSLLSSQTHNNVNQEKETRHQNEFPSWHPLIVHFPIVLILLAAVFQLASFFVFMFELSWLTMLLIVLGYIGAYISSTYVHPHTSQLSENAAIILTQHELFAKYTLWLSALGAVAKILSHFLLKRKIIPEIIVCCLIIGAGICICIAGHHGAQLVHIEGVGPQGKFLEKHNH